MPSQFRFLGSTPTVDNNTSDAVPPTAKTGAGAPFLLNGLKNAFHPQHTANGSVLSDTTETPDDAMASSGLYGVIKSTNFWFNLQLSQLEKFAVQQAEDCAKVNLPHTEVPVEHELPIETTFKERAREIYKEWISRIECKWSDSIQATRTGAGDKLVELRHGLANLERTAVEINATETTIEEREETLRNQQKRYGAKALLPFRLYIVMMFCLAVIDWIANVPIFNELLPAEFGRREIWRQLAAAAQKTGPLGGAKMLGERLLFHLDVTIFAFGVVAFLMLMAHFLGDGLRRWLVFDPSNEPLLRSTLNAHRRQSYVPILAGFLGILLSIGFLYGSRGRLVQATSTGITQAQKELDEADKAVLEAQGPNGDLNKVPELKQKRDEKLGKRDDWQERDRFAKDIQMMNEPILLLNIVLALTAIVAGYHASAPEVIEGRLEDPLISKLKTKVTELRLEAVEHRRLLRLLEAEAQGLLARAKYLATAEPLGEWEAKAKRLSAVVPLFRAENARARGIDTENIVAFKKPSELELGPPAKSKEIPVALSELEDEFATLRNEIRQHLAGEKQTRMVVHA